jgi:hypothetical protein
MTAGSSLRWATGFHLAAARFSFCAAVGTTMAGFGFKPIFLVASESSAPSNGMPLNKILNKLTFSRVGLAFCLYLSLV